MSRRHTVLGLILGIAAVSGSLPGMASPVLATAVEQRDELENDGVGGTTGLPDNRTADALFAMGCTGLVALMVPAIGLFYGGMVRRKNVLSAFQQSFILLGLLPLQWVLIGYSLAFGSDAFGGLCGGFGWLGTQGVGFAPNAVLAPRLPHQLFMIFEMMVALLPVALISGAIAERMKFASYLIFALLWTTLVYCPVAHWVWGPGGWIKAWGGLDFGGGLAVHLTAGLAALCCAIVLGKRKGLDTEDLHPHNLTLTALGTALLSFSWLGLNAGQARGMSATAVAAFGATILAGGAAMASWCALEFLEKRKVTMLGACTGAIVGLVAVSAAAGYVGTIGAMVLGAGVGPVCYGAIHFKGKLGYDDSLDVFGVHGVGAFTGALALGVLAAPSLTGGKGALLDGRTELLIAQAIAVIAVAVYTVVVTLVILFVLDRVIGLRVSAEEEDLGLDLTQHGQRGYMMGEGELIGIDAN